MFINGGFSDFGHLTGVAGCSSCVETPQMAFESMLRRGCLNVVDWYSRPKLVGAKMPRLLRKATRIEAELRR